MVVVVVVEKWRRREGAWSNGGDADVAEARGVERGSQILFVFICQFQRCMFA